MSAPNPAAVAVAGAILLLGVGAAVWITAAPTPAPPRAPSPTPSPSAEPDPPQPEAPPATGPSTDPAPSPSPAPRAGDPELEDLFASLEWTESEGSAERHIALPPRPEPSPVELRTSEGREARLRDEARVSAERVKALREQLPGLEVSSPPEGSPAQHVAAARAALSAGRVDESLARFAQAQDAGADWSPDLEPIRAAARAFRAAGDDPGHLRWTLEPGADLEDFLTWGPAQAEIATDELQISTPHWFRFGLVSLRGRWRQARVALTLGTGDPAPALGFAHAQASYALRCGAQSLALLDLAARHDEPPLLAVPHACPPGTELEVALEPIEGLLRVRVQAGGDEVLARDLPWSGAVRLSLGTAHPGTARFRALEVHGQPDTTWLRARVADAAEDGWEALREQELSRRDDGQLPLVYARTSAEDEVGLRGVPQAAQDRVAEARDLLRAGDDDLVAQYLQQASARSDDYAAAHVLHARALLASDPLEALAACDKASLAVAGCYEAHACRAEALRRLGHPTAAREALDLALTLRADYAPARVTEAWLALGEGATDAAQAATRLAQLLAPEDPGVAADVRALEAWLAGPGGLSPHDPAPGLRVYAPSEQAAAAAAEQVLRAWARCEQLLGPLLPASSAAPGAPARVVVFEDPAAYARHVRITQQREVGPPWGDFAPATGELIVLRVQPFADAEHRLRREAVQQWLQRRGTVLPGSWAAEGLADLVAGVTARGDGEALGLDPTLREQLRLVGAHPARRLALFDLINETDGWRQTVGNLRYAQAWLVLQWLLEDPELRGTCRSYLRLLAAGGQDPGRERDELLEQAFMATFYEADLVAAEPRFVSWLEARCAALEGK